MTVLHSRQRDLHLRLRYEPEHRHRLPVVMCPARAERKGAAERLGPGPKGLFGLVKEFKSDLENCAFEEGENVHFRKRSL